MFGSGSGSKFNCAARVGLGQMILGLYIYIRIGRYGHFSYRHIACEIADTRYYRAWVGGGKRERLSVLVIGYS